MLPFLLNAMANTADSVFSHIEEQLLNFSRPMLNAGHSLHLTLYQNNLQLFMNAFGREINKDKQTLLCEQFWGSKEIKSPLEIRDILQVNRCILKKAKGQINAIPKAVNACIHSSELTHSQRDLLLASI